MQPSAADFANGIKVGHVGPTVFINHHAATGVMGCRHNGYGLLGNVDTQLFAALGDVGEVAMDEFC